MGTFSRFLMSRPKTTMGSRFYKEPPRVWTYNELFFNEIKNILNLKLPIKKGTINYLDPFVLTLPYGDVKDCWIEYYNRIEKELSNTGIFNEVQDLASKSAENAARIAANLHFLINRYETNISLFSMESACVFALWYLKESKRMLINIDYSKSDINNAKYLVYWLFTSDKSKKLGYTADISFSASDLARVIKNSLRKVNLIKPLLEILFENKWIIKSDKNKNHYVLNQNAFNYLPD